MEEIIALLNKFGPLTGKDVLERINGDEYAVWKFCITSPDIIIRIVGQRYLRFDIQVHEYARLSPSIMREFYNYTIVGTVDQKNETDHCAWQLQNQIIQISQNKYNLAKKLIVNTVELLDLSDTFNKSACVIIAGDVVYNMSNMQLRPEFSTGEIVQGSDLDIVIITNNLDNNTINLLDNAIFQKKYMLLRNPQYREEVDYLIKDMSKVKEQLKFADFKDMVACKILNEGRYLYGNYDLFTRIKSELQKRDIPGKLQLLKQKAIAERNKAEVRLINDSSLLTTAEISQLFYTTSEKEEFF